MLPGVGGSIRELTRNGRDVLRHAPEDVADPLLTACFPLVPYTNRIALGCFAFGGKTYRLPRNFGDHPHSLHGIGWQSQWSLEAAGEATATLSLDHGGDDRWPWRFRAEQRVELDDGGCEIALHLVNLADEAMPAGLGLHPYFPRDEKTRLMFTAQRMWLGDDTMIPTRPVAADSLGDWSAGSGFPDRLIDNSFDGWAGRAIIESDSAGTIRISATGAPVVHLYAPPDADFLCVEPASHLPDALNQGFAMDVLAPGETKILTLRIEA